MISRVVLGYPAFAYVLVLLFVSIGGCGGRNPASPAPAASVALRVHSGEAVLLRGQSGVSTIEYRFCYELTRVGSSDVPISIQPAQGTVLGPNGSTYGTFPINNPPLTNVTGSYPIFVAGCTDFKDSDLARAIAVSYRMHVDYTVVGTTYALNATGTFVNKVPTWPQMTAVTIQDDLDPQRTLRSRRPVTFTASGEGGVPPYDFIWSMNGFLMRDWNKNPTFVWDGTLNGSAVTSGGLVLVVSARSNGGTNAEAGALLNFSVQIPPTQLFRRSLKVRSLTIARLIIEPPFLAPR